MVTEVSTGVRGSWVVFLMSVLDSFSVCIFYFVERSPVQGIFPAFVVPVTRVKVQAG